METFGASRCLSRSTVGPRASWVVVLLGVVFSGALLFSGVEAESSDNATAGLPADSESARAADRRAELDTAATTPALVVYERDGGPLDAADRRFVEGRVAGLLAAAGADGGGAPPVVSEDGQAALVLVPVAADTPEADLADVVDALREAAGADLPDGLSAQVTGGPAFVVDLSRVFEGADVRLLAVTAGVVALLLLITYRSPWLWLVPLAVVGVADQVAVRVVAIGTRFLGFTTDGASVGITSVLVFGAGTNYALLLISRYREELRGTGDRYDAMRLARARSAPAILASAGTVVLALLTLELAQSPLSRNIGLGSALGVVTAAAYVLLVLPAAMTLFGRRLFWPFVPRPGDPDPSRTGLWARVGGAVTARPVAVGAGAVLLLAVCALPLLGLRVGLSETEQFRTAPEAVVGQETLARHFPAGASQPTTVLVPADRADAVRARVEGVDGVERVEAPPRPSDGAGGTTVFSAVLTADPGSDEAFAAVERIRAVVSGGEGEVLVGGSDAEALDAADAASRDRLVVVPLILLVVTLVLLALLRSVVAALLLVVTVGASYLAALGVGWLVFTQVLDLAALDVTVPLLAFLFLVALGVDYNIFLTTRAREEALADPAGGAGTSRAIATALAVTGGVITSAGVLLAAVFAALGVLPVIVLTQIGVIVGFGVLLDTLVVRSLLVPALVTLLGRWFWWPGALSRPVADEASGSTSGPTSGPTPQEAWRGSPTVQ